MYTEFTTDALFTTRTRRIISALVLFFFIFTFYSPAVASAVDKARENWNPPVNSLEHVNPVGKTLESLNAQVRELKQTVADSGEKGDRPDVEPMLEEIATLADEFVERDEQTRAEIRSTEAHLRNEGVAGKVLERHQAYKQHYQRQADAVREHVQRLAEWKPQEQNLDDLKTAIDDLQPYLEYPARNPQESFSNDLDFVSPPPRSLFTEQSDINALLNLNGDETWSQSDFLETDSATAAGENIEEKVSELSGDPLAMFQWVHDNLDYVPSYGVMQGADYTLASGRGNAFDISSTLIAMYREAGIPARYSYGTVALPAEAVQNWVGDVANVDAATNILSQGGIPQTQVSYGGAAEEIEMEHVWVEAYVDGQWVALDPSFKQYDYQEGVDIESEVPLDAEGLVNQLESGATVNESEGWVQGVDAASLQTELNDYQSQVESFINNQHPDATLGEVLGSRSIIPNEADSLAAVELPYEQIQASAVRPNLPQGLFYEFRLQIGDTTGGQFGIPVQWNSLQAELDRPTPELLGKDLAISFRPASQADEQAIASYIPDDLEDPEDLPSSLPANSIHMIGEITLDGEVVESTGQVTLGEAMMTRLGYVKPQHGWRKSENHLTAGQYQAVGLDMQGISPDQLESLQSDLEGVQSKLEAEDFSGLTRHDLTGAILQSGIQGYLAETYAMDRIAAQSSGIIYHRSPSYGTFSTSMQVQYNFGIAQKVLFSGVVMDMDRIESNTESRENCYEDWVAFNRSSGMRSSAYEHIIPERLFSTENSQAEGVSTAKALSKAMADGQRIYTLTEDNEEQLSNITIDDEARSEIQQALSRGYEVTVHQKPINVNGWEGSGYSIIDPERGVGAYKISGGVNGGVLQGISTGLSGLLGGIGGFLEKYKTNQIGKVLFSPELERLQKLAGKAGTVGALGLIAQLVNIGNGDADTVDKVGQASSAVFGFALTSFLTSSLLATAPALLAILGGILIAVAVSVVMAQFTKRYFK
ncbi:transglutaminase-like domain-containing protein [Salicola sp. Rm-C-2C1-2]|uniref:transglutaminase-like domain-containing protein n=1 Tax=Salicola sp. Rm-C-2C1-2 TaxID=3141321 RepID=UPI0032E45843